MMLGQMQRSGLDAIGELPWGTHFCQFYETPQDLLDVLVAYFQQGLQNNEFCMWVTSEPLGVEEAKHALRRVVPDLDERILQGQFEFWNYRPWYFPDGQFDAERVLQGWVEKERTALARGYEGMRLTGDLSWLEKDNWKAFSDYEATVNAVIGSHRILALCTYSLGKCSGVEMLDVLRNHPLALVKKEGKWEVIQSPHLGKATEELQKSEQRQKAILDTIPDPAWLKDKEGRFLAVNAAWCRFFGVDAKNILGKTACEFLPAKVALEFEEHDRNIVLSGHPLHYEELLSDKDGRPIWFETIKSPLLNEHGEVVGTTGLARDITTRKAAQQKLQESESVLRGFFDSPGTHRGIIEVVGDDILHLSDNAASAAFFGRSQESMHGKFATEMGVPKEVVQKWIGHYEESKRTNHPVKFEYRHVSENGEKWLLATVSFLQGSSNGNSRYVYVVIDITDLKRTEATLRETQDRLALAANAAQIGIFDWDVRTGEVTWTQPHEAIFGYSPTTAAATTTHAYRDWADRVHPDDLPLVEERIRQCMTERTLYQVEYRIVWPDGSYHWIAGQGRAYYDDEGSAARMLGTVQDITERRLAEELLRQSEERYRFMVEVISLGGWMCDAQGRNTYVSPSFLDKLGMTAQQAQEFGWANALMPDDLGEPLDRWRECVRTGKDWEGEWHFRTKDGTYCTALSRGRAIRDSRGQIVGWVGVDLDITDRKRAEEEKLEMERRFLHAQKLESLGILAGGIAHDFNNILAGIMGYADLAMARLPSSEPAREDLDVIKNSVRRAAGLTRQMLAYSGKGNLIVEPVSLSQIVKDMRAMLEMSISKKAVLNCKLDADLPMVEAEASQVHQIILNLVINASEALGEESGVIVVSTDIVQCSVTDCAALGGGNDLREGLYVRLEVTDTGCGMDEQTLAKIFDPFFTTKFTGRGLGLAAVHGILRGHKGGIRVSSTPGEGTTIQVLFPAIETSAAILAGESIPAKPWHGSGTVLVVDDEEVVRSLAKRMIEAAGFSVRTASDGEEAVRLYREHQNEIACVLLDLTMPKMSGEETFRTIRQISPGVRVILSSGYSEESATGQFSGLGLAGFIQKPYQLETMVATLREAVTRAS